MPLTKVEKAQLIKQINSQRPVEKEDWTHRVNIIFDLVVSVIQSMPEQEPRSLVAPDSEGWWWEKVIVGYNPYYVWKNKEDNAFMVSLDNKGNSIKLDKFIALHDGKWYKAQIPESEVK